MKKRIFLFCLPLLLPLMALAQEAEALRLHRLDSEQTISVKLDQLQRITFTSGGLVVKKTTGSETSTPIEQIRRLTFGEHPADNDVQHTVTFNSNGGSPVTAATVNDNTTVTQPDDPTRTGYTFDGWYNGGTAFNFTTPITDNITLTAQWTAVAVTPPTAINTTEQDALRLYPNPVTSGELRIESGKLQAGEAIAVYNLSGAQVAVYQATGNQTTINISHLPSGAYLVKIGNENQLIINN